MICNIVVHLSRVKQILEEIEQSDKKKQLQAPSYCRRVNVELQAQFKGTSNALASINVGKLVEKNVELRLSQGFPQNQAFYLNPTTGGGAVVNSLLANGDSRVPKDHQTLLQYLSGTKKVEYAKDDVVVPSEKLWNKIKVRSVFRQSKRTIF